MTECNQFVDEEVNSNYTYPKGYKYKEIVHQVIILQQLFPELRYSTKHLLESDIIDSSFPFEAEGWFAIPRWEKLGSTYGEAVEKVLATIKSKRKFYNYRKGQLGAEYLRQHEKTVKAFRKFEQKGHNILIVPAQFGLRHRGRSVRRAREVMNAGEFGLGAFAIGIMLLTHPNREVQHEQLHIDCAGDEFSSGADGNFSDAPLFDFDFGVERVGFSVLQCDLASEHYGSASGFLPQ